MQAVGSRQQSAYLYLPPSGVERSALNLSLEYVNKLPRFQQPRDLEIRVARGQILLINLIGGIIF